ncbi:SDR family NAD(P)-dependent oxidoreductase, partial [Lysobacter sp. 2RAB21]
MSDSNSPAAAPGQRLAGKCVLVSGSSNGIGAAIAKLFVAHGARVAGYDRAPPPDGHASPCEFFAAGDVADAEAVAAFVSDAAQRLGGIDAVINNAGVDVFSDPLTLAQDDWWRNLAINLGGAWNFSRAALPMMLAQGRGSVVNIASVHGHKI